MQPSDHWEQVYRSKPANEVSWFQPRAERSLALIRGAGLAPDAPLIDVGGGASTLVDDLLAAGFAEVSVLDLSPSALAASRERLSAQGREATFIAGDVLTAVLPEHHYALWHDRAVFHFLTGSDDRQRYRSQVLRSLAPRGHLLIATFAEDGPERCSGLPVMRYSAEQLAAEFGSDFSLEKAERETHATPWGSPQHFTYCRFRKN